MSLASQDDESELPQLPPLDDDTDADEGPEDALHDLSLPLEEDLDLDDEEAADLDTGISLSHEEEDDNVEEPHELTLDIGELLADADESEESASDDAAGPTGFNVTLDVESLPDESVLGEEDDGTLEDPSHLVADELPSIDADADGLHDEAVQDDFTLLGAVRDEAPPPPAAQPWAQHATALDGPISALALLDDGVLAGEQSLTWMARDGEVTLREASRFGRVVSLTALNPGEALCATATGKLLRTSGEHAPLLDGWRGALGLRPSAPVSLTLCGAPHSPAILALSSDQRLLRVENGENFAPIDLHAPVLTLAADDARYAALTRERSGYMLLWSDDGGMSWLPRALDASAQAVAAGSEPLLAVGGPLVALGDSERGVVLSLDSGETFRRVQGCGGVSALCLGELGGETRLWAALYRDAEDVSDIVLVDPRTLRAERIARIESPAASDESGEARVMALLWDRERLWVAGGSGVSRVAPPHAG